MLAAAGRRPGTSLELGAYAVMAGGGPRALAAGLWKGALQVRPRPCGRAHEEGVYMQQIQWQDRFCIGVDIVDQAHRRLFTIVQKIMDLYVERHEDKFACVEGIKYFKAYALKHFAEEEAYMREIGYAGYAHHKRLHDRMRRETLPALERELYDTDFSTAAVQHFIGVCTGWLTGHITIEDRAITGSAASEFPRIALDDELSVIQTVILRPLQELFGAEVQFLGAYSPEEVIPDAQYYELSYRGWEGRRLRFVLIIGEQPLLHAAGLIFGAEFYEKDEIVRFAMQEVAQNLIQRAAACFGQDPGEYQLEGERFLEEGCLLQRRAPQYSLLFSLHQTSFALCIDSLSDAAGPGR